MRRTRGLESLVRAKATIAYAALFNRLMSQYVDALKGYHSTQRVMRRNNLRREDIVMAKGDLGKDVEAATIPYIYPHPIIRNTRNTERFYRSFVREEGNICDRLEIDEAWLTHEMDHLGPDTRVSPEYYGTLEGRLDTESRVFRKSFDGYAGELAHATGFRQKQKAAAKARFMLRRYLGTNKGYYKARGTQYDYKGELGALKQQLAAKLRPLDFYILFKHIPPGRSKKSVYSPDTVLKHYQKAA
jgi:hypothetical protein